MKSKSSVIVYCSVALAFILVVVFCGWLLFAPRTVAPQYSRFLHQNTNYYSEFGHACDVVLAANPLGTNVHRVIPLDSVSLPKIIRDLSPQKIDVESNHLWIQVGRGHADGFGIVWEEKERANHWVLTTIREGQPRTVYFTDR